MKMKSLCLAMALIAATCQYVNAADGTLKFKGEVVNSSCTVNGMNNQELDVAMGKIPLSKLTQDFKGPEVGVTITITGCEEGDYYLVLDGTSATEANKVNVLALDDADAPGTAQNVGIILTDRNDNAVTLDQPLNKDNDPVVHVTSANGGGTFYLKASYYAWGQAANIKSGVADATARFTVIQQ